MIQPTTQRIAALEEFLGIDIDHLWPIRDEEFGLIAGIIFDWYNQIGERYVNELRGK